MMYNLKDENINLSCGCGIGNKATRLIINFSIFIAVVVFVVCLIYSSIFYGVLFIASIVLLIIAIKKASKYKKWYIITSISPFILEIIFVLMGAICSTL